MAETLHQFFIIKATSKVTGNVHYVKVDYDYETIELVKHNTDGSFYNTREEAEKFLKQDLTVFEDYVNSLGVCEGNQGRFDALTDFAYNCGVENLKTSTLLKYIREHRSEDEIRHEFLRWVYSGGTKLKGLEKRRMWEANLFFNKKRSFLNSFIHWLKSLFK